MRLIAQMEPFDKYLRVNWPKFAYIAVAGASLELALLLSVLVSIPSAAPQRRPNVLGNLFFSCRQYSHSTARNFPVLSQPPTAQVIESSESAFAGTLFAFVQQPSRGAQPCWPTHCEKSLLGEQYSHV